jgi:hypothetical protein
MNIKKYLVALFLLVSNIAFAQTDVQVVVAVLPPYQQNISDYQLHPERIALKLINTTNVEINVQIAANLTGDNGVAVKTKAGYRGNQPIRIPPTSSVNVDALQIIQLFDLSNLDIIGTDRVAFEKTGILPEGDYRLCVRAYNFRTLDPYSQDEPIGCSNVIPLYNVEPPVILSPISTTVVAALPVQNIIFNWTTPAGAPPTLQYILRIVEVPENRNPWDAMMSNTVIPTFEQTVNSNVFLYGPGQPQIIKGKKYAMMVTVKDPFNKIIFRNNGRSEVGWFIMGIDGVEPPAGGGPPIVVNPPPPPPPGGNPPYVPNESIAGNCSNSCNGILPVEPEDKTQLKVGEKIIANGFNVTITEINPISGGKFSGKGTMPVPFINSSFAKLRVNFTDVKVTAAKKMLEGIIKANVRPGGPNLVPVGQDQTVAMLNHTKSEIQNIVAFVKNDPLQQVTSSLNQIGFELPLGINSDPFMLAVTEVVVTPEQAYFSVVTSVDIPENNDNLGLTARNICMNGPTDICGDMELYLSNDFNIDVLNLKLKAPKKNAGGKLDFGTYMKLVKKDDNKIEVKDFNVLAEFTFPAKSLVDAATKQPLMTTFEFNANKGWANWKAELTMPEFYVDGADEIKFNLAAKKATYDHSDIENPLGLPSPYKSTDTSEADIATNLKTWHGLFFPQVVVTMPDAIKSSSDPNKGIVVNATNLIFDKGGFSGKIEGTNIISIGDGSLAGWYASVDTVRLNFWKSIFKSSVMTGKLVLPPSGSTGVDINNKKNQLDYRCLLTNAKDKPFSYQFTVKPKDDIDFKVFYAKVKIDATSNILVENRPKVSDPSKMEFFAMAKLDGKLGVDDRVQKIPGIVGVSIPDLEFKNIVIKTTKPYIGDSAVFKFNSPQKGIAGFSASFKNAGFIFELGAETKVGIKIKANVNLIGDENATFSLAAEGNFGLYAKIGGETLMRPTWEGVGMRVDDIALGADVNLGALKLTGALKFYNKESPSDCGFVGALAIKIPSVDVGINMKAQFGSAGSGASEFKYFNFEALADFGQVGIPMFAGINLYGLGGGVHYNMQGSTLTLPSVAKVQAAKSNDDKSATTGKSALELLNYSPSGQVFTPSKGSFGLSATALFGLAQRNTLDADATFSINFNENGGVSDINLNGNIRAATDVTISLPSRNLNSLIYGKINAGYDFEHKIFDVNATVEMKFPISTGDLILANGDLQFKISQQGWYLHVGRPTLPLMAQMLKFNGKYIFKSYTYFEAGSYNIDPMPPVPQEIRNLAGPMANQIPSIQGLPRGSNTAGFIHGAYTVFDVEGKFLFLYGRLAAGMGYDIAFKKYDELICNGSNGGANGWYATGQAYLGVNAKIGIDFGGFFGKADIFEGGAVATIQAGLPNPTWVVGAITGYYNVFGGVFEGTFNYKFELGTKCVPPNPLGVDFSLIADVSPADNAKDVEIIATPQASFNFRVNKGTFEYKQLKDDGATFTRYFKFDRSTIDITMTGNGKIFDNTKFRTVPGNANSIAFVSNDMLDPEKDYVLVVKARLLEAKNNDGNYQPIKNSSNKIIEEIQTYHFKTGKGIKVVTNDMYVNSYPLHSHNQFIDESAATNYSVNFTKTISAYQFDVPNSANNAKIYAVLLKNDVAVANKLVTVGTKKWTFDKFTLDQSSRYRIDFVVKGDEVAASGETTKVGTMTTTKDGTLLKGEVGVSYVQGINSNVSRAVAGATVAYIKFATSAYKTYQEKIDAMEIRDISFVINGGTSTQALKEFSPMVGQLANATLFKTQATLTNGVYKLRSVNNTFNYTGERFAVPDFQEYTSDEIFKHGKGLNGEIRPFAALHQYFDVIASKNADKFISDVTGIPQSQIQTDFKGLTFCGGQGVLPYLISFPSNEKFGEQISVPYVAPPALPSKYGYGNGFGVSAPVPGGSGQYSLIKPPAVVSNQNIKAPCAPVVGGQINFTLAGFMNPVVNPAGYSAANNAGAWGAFNVGMGALGLSGAAFSPANISSVGNASFR